MNDTNQAQDPILQVKDLVIEFNTDKGLVRAVDGISFDVYPGETLGIVGESGCGKSVTALALLGLIPSPPGLISNGSIKLAGRELVGLPEQQIQHIRGNQIAMIFQEPMTALNPVFTINNQMSEVLCRHKDLNKSQARDTAIEMLRAVGIPAAEKRIDDYPHQLSGGMRQRVMIAMALSCGPKLLIADEPTTALDVTTQAQVLEEMVKLQEQFGMAVLLITHDLGVVAETCRQAMVMYCGKVVEYGDTHDLFHHPRHPYTHGLLQSIPRIREHKIDRLPIIPGMVPDLMHLPDGCRFADRCEKANGRCQQDQPPLLQNADSPGQVACFSPYS